MLQRQLRRALGPAHPSAFLLQDVPVEALTTVRPYCNEIHAQAQLWLKRDPKASYEAWKKCLPIRGVSVFRDLRSEPFLPLADCPIISPFPLPAPLCLPGIDGNGKSPSKSELRHLYLTEKYVWRWKQFLSRRGTRASPLDLKLGHNNWLRQVSDRPRPGPLRPPWPQVPGGVFPPLTAGLLCSLCVSPAPFLLGGGSRCSRPRGGWATSEPSAL